MAPGSPSIPWSPDPSTGVRARGLDAAYGRRGGRVLCGVDLDADPGGVTALVGPNGAGKTTLFRILLGFLPPSSGSVTVEGASPAAYRRSRGIAYLPEAGGAPSAWRVGELFLEGARLAGLPSRERAEAVARAVERSGLDAPALERPLSGLSRGMLRRAQLAYALLGDPGLVLLDEPWSGLDPPSRVHLRAAIRGLTARGATVILASHELEEVQRMAERAVLLSGGRVLEVVHHPGSLPHRALERALLRQQRE